MFFRIDPDSGVAIYDQIARQVKYAVAQRAIRPGELVPSVRELALRLAVNPNTVARAYRDLQTDGVLETLRGEGLRVAAAAFEHCQQARRQNLEERLLGVVIEAQQSGCAEKDFLGMAQQVWNQVTRSQVVKQQRVADHPA